MVWCSSIRVHSSLLTRIRYSLAGQDTRLSPERPGFESRWRNLAARGSPKIPETVGSLESSEAGAPQEEQGGEAKRRGGGKGQPKYNFQL